MRLVIAIALSITVAGCSVVSNRPPDQVRDVPVTGTVFSSDFREARALLSDEPFDHVGIYYQDLKIEVNTPAELASMEVVISIYLGEDQTPIPAVGHFIIIMATEDKVSRKTFDIPKSSISVAKKPNQITTDNSGAIRCVAGRFVIIKDG